ncbi:GntR family transcriptional regulator [Brevibacterium sp. 50QC2O2]|jgi:DNA-binding GntR family transcriptional regulator|uniref:GntR family transcriptional regulator n=1 Tax=Brevibacterium sp. 50QC2O2 TaxID=2968459 RepID=UPI00211BD269|nr:GntR family transcriptional regulator [Brevibacterium sp. 50QC2O2]MCQ9388713.1 GntR family transcriptional regulator [Brevibacterium sp. 50QC2O2]
MQTKRDIIAEALRRRILSGELERGVRLRQDQVAHWFDASITPVREALQRLESDGLVISEAHRGVRVAGVDFGWVTGLYQIRMLLEPYAMRRAVLRISRFELQGAQRILADLRAAVAAGDGPGRNKLTRDFHFFFYERAGSPGLAAEIANKWDAFPWDLTLDDDVRTGESTDEHAELLDAAHAVDAEGAGALMADHIRTGFLAAARALGRSDVADPFDIAND